MSSVATYDAFHARLTASWTTTDLVFENDKFKLPKTPEAFVYVEIVGGDYPQASIGAPGSNLFRESGVTYLHVMVPDDTGSRAARGHADALTALFRETDTDGVKIDDMAIGSGDPGRSFANYWALTVTLWWHRHDYSQP